MGMPKHQVAFIHEANTEVRKKELFAKVRTGDVRVLLGSTAKCGAGTNIQDRLVALHDLDCPWRPGDLTQRSGRIERQGNLNEQVGIYRYVTEATFDAYLWQTVENKQKFISQIMTSKSPVRSCEDVDEAALSYAEIKALCAGNPKIKEKMDLDIDVARLKLLKSNHQSSQYRLEDNLLKYFPENIEKNRGYIKGFEQDLQTLKAHIPKDGEFIPMLIKNDTLTDKDNAGAALLEACKEVKGSESVEIGSYRGFSNICIYLIQIGRYEFLRISYIPYLQRIRIVFCIDNKLCFIALQHYVSSHNRQKALTYMLEHGIFFPFDYWGIYTQARQLLFVKFKDKLFIERGHPPVSNKILENCSTLL